MIAPQNPHDLDTCTEAYHKGNDHQKPITMAHDLNIINSLSKWHIRDYYIQIAT